MKNPLFILSTNKYGTAEVEFLFTCGCVIIRTTHEDKINIMKFIL